jgi:hypothetical protein
MSLPDDSFRLAPLDSPAAEIMADAFETAWAALCASGERLSAQQVCDARIRLARVILEGVQGGERDVARLSELALVSLETAGDPDERMPVGRYL